MKYDIGSEEKSLLLSSSLLNFSIETNSLSKYSISCNFGNVFPKIDC